MRIAYWRGLVIVGLLSLGALPASAQTFQKPSYIQWQAAGIRKETSPDIRRAKSAFLLKNILAGRVKIVSDEDIDALANLLSDDSLVQSHIAMALGWFGPRSRRAIPALTVAIARWDNRKDMATTGVLPPSVMCKAIGQIDFAAMPVDCADWGGDMTASLRFDTGTDETIHSPSP